MQALNSNYFLVGQNLNTAAQPTGVSRPSQPVAQHGKISLSSFLAGDSGASGAAKSRQNSGSASKRRADWRLLKKSVTEMKPGKPRRKDIGDILLEIRNLSSKKKDAR